MNIGNFENFLGNSAFVFLFLSMILYWVQLTFSFQKWNFGKIFMIGANLSLFTFLALRWIESGHFPLSNLYESLIFLSWSLSTFHLLLEMNQFRPKTFFNLSENQAFPSTLVSTVPSVQSSPALSSPDENRETKEFVEKQQTHKKNEAFFSAFTSPAPLFINAFATFTLPKEMQNSSPLVPALQSNWLMMHVTVMILSYAALICGCLLSIAFLIVTANVQKDSSESTTPSLKQGFGDILDNLSYRMVGLGFPFLTIGILSGAVWANEAWGSYWSWDPKETWALATWLIFAIYLHTRLTKGWRGKKPAFIATFGFFVVWICFLGVNLLGEGLHSYGFFQK